MNINYNKMKNVEIVNCYCFNPKCKSSIFSSGKNITVYAPLSSVLSQPIHCEECNSELVSKCTLELKSQINKSLNKGKASDSILYGQEPVYILI
jgi:hypothetical protein